MAKRKRMDQIKTILRCYLATQSIKATARTLQVSKNTVREYLRRAHTYSTDLASILEIEDEAFLSIFTNNTGMLARDSLFEKDLDTWLDQLQKPGVTRRLLWEEYREQNSDGYGYSQFCLLMNRSIRANDLTLAIDHEPGDVMMLDFAGKKLSWTDPISGDTHYCEVLVAVMPFSHFCFCIALPSQRLNDFVHGINQALLYMQGLPNKILSDNLKSYVVKSDRYEPKFTQLCEQLADYYNIQLTATRVAKPKDKASVENAVAQVYRSIYAPLRQQTFDSLDNLNEAIRQQLYVMNNKPFQKRDGTRSSIFEHCERPVMRPLPSDLFEVKKQTLAKVQRNYHVFLGEDKHFYSVPYTFVGQKAEVIYTRSCVEVYIQQRRVALHKRLSQLIGPNKYQSQIEHMPKHHREWKQAMGYNAAYFVSQAERIGPATQWAIEQVLISRFPESQSYNSCKGILHLARTSGDQRMENACLRCQANGKATYQMIKNILKHNLDLQEEPPESWDMGTHDNIRGAEYYQ